MAGEPPFQIHFYRSTGGAEPGRAWLKALSAADKRIIGQDLKTVQFRWPLGMPLVRALGDGLWEVRSSLPSRIARVLFMVERTRIVLLHAFIKKTQKTPTEDRALALKRRHAYTRQTED